MDLGNKHLKLYNIKKTTMLYCRVLPESDLTPNFGISGKCWKEELHKAKKTPYLLLLKCSLLPLDTVV